MGHSLQTVSADDTSESAWKEILSEIDLDSFTGRLVVSTTNDSTSAKLPPPLRVSSYIAIRTVLLKTSPTRVAIVFPASGDSAKWVSLIASLALMQAEFSKRLSESMPLRKRDRLVYNNSTVVEYEGTRQMHGEEFLKLNLADSGSFYIPARQRLLLQHTSAKKNLSKRISKQEPDVVDELLGISALGNRSIFTRQVAIVCSAGKLREWERGTLVNSFNPKLITETKHVSELVQCGGVDSQNEVRIWSPQNLAADPVLLGISDLSSANEFLDIDGALDKLRLIVVDGGRRILADLQEFDELLDTAPATLVVLESPEEREITVLRERGFTFWNWTREELSDVVTGRAPTAPTSTDSFSNLRRRWENYGRFVLEEELCHDKWLLESWEVFRELDGTLKAQNSQLGRLVGQFLSTLLLISRLLRPATYASTTDDRRETQKRLDDIVEELEEQSQWLSAALVEKTRAALEGFREALGSDRPPPKAAVLEDYLATLAPEKKAAVVVDSVESCEPTRKYWKQQGITSVTFVTAHELKDEAAYDVVVVCGWLGRATMRNLITSWATPSVRVLATDFERAWLRSARKWWSQRDRIDDSRERTSLLGRKITTPPPSPAPAEESASQHNDLSDFELRLHFIRRQDLLERAATNASGEEIIEARLIELSDGYYSFLTEIHHVPVVTEFLSSRDADEGAPKEIKEATVSELHEGDFVLFRESAEGSVIRALADIGLAEAGKSHLRQTAALWRDALHRYREKLNGDTSAVIKRLRQAGCRTTPFTIRYWLNADRTIGPRSDSTIDLIGKITDDSVLTGKTAQVRSAIREVRSAHLQASGFLIKKLLEVVPSHLIDRGNGSFRLEIEGVGAAVVCRIESIDDKYRQLPESRVNRLERE
jgi:hypothetical protein